MEFNDLIQENIDQILVSAGFKLLNSSYKNSVIYVSDQIVLNFSYNLYDRQSGLTIGFVNKEKVELDDEAMVSVFDTDLKVFNLTKEDFIKNISIFFKNGGIAKVKKTENITSLINHSKEKSRKYTDQMTLRIHSNHAEKYWAEKRYAELVNVIESHLLNFDIPRSMLLKYNYAKKKILKP